MDSKLGIEEAKLLLVQPTAAQKLCQHCRFLQVAEGLSRPIFVCRRKKGANKRLMVIEADQVCANFVRRRVALPIDLNDPDIVNIRLIPLTRGMFAIVDAADYEWLSQWKWYALKAHGTYYAVRNGKGKKSKQIRMHRVITDAPDGMVVDHIDHDGLNNRRSNLRVCTDAENLRNTRARKGTSSKYKGVGFWKRDKKYRAKIEHKGKCIHIGYFEDEKDAAKAYDKKAAELFGEFACLNF